MNPLVNEELTRERIISIATAVAKDRYGMTLEEFISAVRRKQLDSVWDMMEVIGLLSLLPEYETELAAA
jgi:hypothetical protein